jgi:hypothetical protein
VTSQSSPGARPDGYGRPLDTDGGGAPRTPSSGDVEAAVWHRNSSAAREDLARTPEHDRAVQALPGAPGGALRARPGRPHLACSSRVPPRVVRPELRALRLAAAAQRSEGRHVRDWLLLFVCPWGRCPFSLSLQLPRAASAVGTPRAREHRRRIGKDDTRGSLVSRVQLSASVLELPALRAHRLRNRENGPRAH